MIECPSTNSLPSVDKQNPGETSFFNSMNEPSPLPNFLDTDLRKAGEAPPKKGFVITTYVYSNMRYKTHKTKKTKKVQTLVLLDTQSTGNFVTREYLAKNRIPYTDLGPVSCDVTTITGTSELRTM